MYQLSMIKKQDLPSHIQQLFDKLAGYDFNFVYSCIIHINDKTKLHKYLAAYSFKCN